MSSFFDCYVVDSAENISNVVGPWKNYGDDKTLRNWTCKIKGHDFEYEFEIYDYKEYRDIKEDEICEYHIGANSRQESLEIVKLLKKLGLNAHRDTYFLIH